MDVTRTELVTHMIHLLENDQFKDTFLEELNAEVDIPILDEKKEGKIFKALYKVLLKSIKKQLTES